MSPNEMLIQFVELEQSLLVVALNDGQLVYHETPAVSDWQEVVNNYATALRAVSYTHLTLPTILLV